MRRKHQRQQRCQQQKQQYQYNQQQNRFISYSNYLKKKEQNQIKILQKIDYNHAQVSVKKRESDLFKFLRQKGNQQVRKNALSDNQNLDTPYNQELIAQNLKSSGTQWGNKSTQDTFFSTDNKFKQNFIKSDSKNFHKQKQKNKINPVILEKAQISKNREQYQLIDSKAVVIKGKLIYLKQDGGQLNSKDHLLYLLNQNNISYKQYLSADRESILQKIRNNQSQKQNQIIKDYILRNMSEQNNGQILIMERFHQIKNNLFD